MTGRLQSRIRKRVFFFLGLALLLFAGYAITLRGRRMEARKAVTLLGEHGLKPGAMAGMRLIGWDLKWERPLPIERVTLEISRPPGTRAVLARAYPGTSVVDLNVRIPSWPAGPAVLTARVETGQGEAVLEAGVELDPLNLSKMHLVPPSKELTQAPVLIRQGPAGFGSEAGRSPGATEPGRFSFYPPGGGLTSTFASRLLVRVLDARGEPVTGKLQVDDGETRATDQQGFVEVLVRERQHRLRLTFTGEAGSLGGNILLGHAPSQVDAATSDFLVPAGRPLAVHLRTLSPSTRVHLDAWWRYGWFFSGQVQTSNGSGLAQVEIPAMVEGVLTIRARLDPFGQGEAMRDVSVIGHSGQRPSPGQAWVMVKKIPAEEGFWSEIGRMDPDTEGKGLQAVLSRVKMPGGPLPRLADGQDAEERTVTARKQDMVRFGLWTAAVVSSLAWLAAAWWLLAGWWRSGKNRRKRALVVALSATGLIALALGLGWLWLYWVSKDLLG